MEYHFNYQLDENEWVDFNMYHLQHLTKRGCSSVMIRIYVLAFFFIILGLYFISGADTADIIRTVAIGLPIVILVFFWKKFYYMFVRYSTRKQYRQGKYATSGQLTFDFQDDQYVHQSSDGTSTLNYSSLHKFAEGTKAYYLYTRENAAYILPFRIFEDENQRQAFKTFIESKIVKTHKG